ncbi:hypothetical protein [Prevotella sp.]|uniref:hypothetical protein n=1 Tax=Prevotella sp. TaxID=59823 RepID=UPI003AB7E1B2
MKHFSTLLLAMFAIGASAQSGGTGALLDETYQFTDGGDGLFRYVFAYDSNKQRSSETIYYKERNAGVWGSESLYEVGNYSYQFDSKGRLKVKEVKYSLGKPEFQTYRIMVDYNDTAAAGEAVNTFKRYTLADDNNYQLEEQWSLYANGQLASHSLFNSYDAVSHRYDENGTINAILSYDFSGDRLVTKVTKSGTLNDSTIVHYKDGMPSWTERYRYDGKTGRPLEYTTWGKTVDAFHNVWEYDAQGRIVLDEHYIDSADDDVDYPTVAALSGKRSKGARLPFMSTGRSEAAVDARKADAAPRRNRTESTLTEPEWKLDERITYKYYNDEVYPVSNSWRSVMYMEGPLSECVFLEKGDETEPDYEERIVCTRDASGKLTAVNHTYSKETDREQSSVYVVDAAGHVTRRTYTNKETSGDRTDTYVEDNQYVWDSDHCVSMVETNGYTTGQQTKTSHVYTYDTAANKLTDELRITHENGTDEPSTVTYTVQQNGTSVEATNKESAYYTSRYIREVQQEDVSFIAPNMLKDFDGAYPEPRTVISVKGRVVTTATGPRGKYYGYVEVPALNDADNQYLTLAPGQYFSVKCVGNQLVCSDIDGFPVYVVEGNLLKKEYIYLDNTSSVTPQTSVAPVTKAADGVECTEVEYFYSQYGLLVGQTLTDISADGKRTENISIEYKYDEATGIGTYEATTAKMQLSGRSLGLTDGTTFSVYTLGGKQLAANVADYTFASSGVYIVKVGGKSVKLTVK